MQLAVNSATALMASQVSDIVHLHHPYYMYNFLSKSCGINGQDSLSTSSSCLLQRTQALIGDYMDQSFISKKEVDLSPRGGAKLFRNNSNYMYMSNNARIAQQQYVNNLNLSYQASYLSLIGCAWQFNSTERSFLCPIHSSVKATKCELHAFSIPFASRLAVASSRLKSRCCCFAYWNEVFWNK